MSARTRDGDIKKDVILPFLLESSGIRGRVVRLSDSAKKVIGSRSYPPILAGLLAELLALTCGLSSLLKYDGIFSIQTKSDGPVSMLVADITSSGNLRGYAGFEDTAFAALLCKEGSPSFKSLVGRGHLAFTVDQGGQANRYQGIVDLNGDSLADCFQHYFLQSEQVNTGTVLAADNGDAGWSSGALILQHMPEEGAVRGPESTEEMEENWRRAMMLQATCTAGELLDPGLPLTDLLYRLFHEEGVRVFEPRPVQAKCRCSRSRLETFVKTMTPEELEPHIVEGAVEFTCEFCGRVYSFREADLKTANS